MTSSPRYPLGNSEAERAVQTVKRLLSKCDDIYEAIMIYRVTPLPHIGLSPSQMLFGRQIKTSLPQATKKLMPSHINFKQLQNNKIFSSFVVKCQKAYICNEVKEKLFDDYRTMLDRRLCQVAIEQNEPLAKLFGFATSIEQGIWYWLTA